MGETKHSCNKMCECSEQIHRCELIVLTGGPGAGKTAVLETLKTQLCEHMTILPEAASIVFGGGFWRLESDSAKTSSQKAIFHVQRGMEELVLTEEKWGVGLCDRGSLDGLAYCPLKENLFWDCFKTDKETEYKRYKAIIHLRTPQLSHGYNHQNPIRIESAEQAALIDNKIHEMWKHHPNYFMVNETKTFSEKIQKSYSQIADFVPECCKSHFQNGI